MKLEQLGLSNADKSPQLGCPRTTTHLMELQIFFQLLRGK